MDIVLISSSEHLQRVVSSVLVANAFGAQCYFTSDSARKSVPDDDLPEMAILLDSRCKQLVKREVEVLRDWLGFRPILVGGQSIDKNSLLDNTLGLTHCLNYPVSGRHLLKAVAGALNLYVRQRNVAIRSHLNQ